jgi:hypothetical protein
MTARSGLLFASSCRYRLRIGTVQMTVGPTRSIATSPADPGPVRARHQVITHAGQQYSPGCEGVEDRYGRA